MLEPVKAVEKLSCEKIYDTQSIHHQEASRWGGHPYIYPFLKHFERHKRRRKSPIRISTCGLVRREWDGCGTPALEASQNKKIRINKS